MADFDINDRLKEIFHSHEDYPLTFPIVLVGAFVGILIVIGLARIENFDHELYKDAINVIITVGIIELIIRWRDQREQKRTHSILSRHLGRRRPATEAHPIFFEMIIRDALSQGWISQFDIRWFGLDGAKLNKVMFKHCNMRHTTWNKVEFSRATIIWGDIKDATFLDCQFNNAIISSSDLSDSHITSSTFVNVRLEVMLCNAVISDVIFNKTDFSNSAIENTHFLEVNFKGTNLTKVSLVNSVFINCTFDDSTILPDGSLFRSDLGKEQLDRFTNIKNSDFHPVNASGYALDIYVPFFEDDDDELRKKLNL